MINPKLKTAEYYNELHDIIMNGGELSEFEYKRILKLLTKDKSNVAICAVGFAHAIMGKKDDAIKWFKSFSPFSELFLLKGYGATLRFLGMNKELIKVSLEYSDLFHDTWFSWKNMDYYYTIGDISNSARKAREFLSMLLDDENKKRTECAIAQQLDVLSLIYSSGHCTPEQFRIFSDLVLDILDKHEISLRYVEMFYWGEEGTSYEIGVPVKEGDFTTLRKLNDELIKRIIKIEELDGCEVMPCFTRGGMSDWRYVHGA